MAEALGGARRAAAAGKVRGGALRVRAYVASPQDLKQLNAPPPTRAAQRVGERRDVGELAIGGTPRGRAAAEGGEGVLRGDPGRPPRKVLRLPGGRAAADPVLRRPLRRRAGRAPRA